MGTQALWCIQSSSFSNSIEQIGFGSLSHAASVSEDVEHEGQAVLGTPRKKVPIGADFQAEVPQFILSDKKSGFNLEKPEPDSLRWLGERVWPIHECDLVANDMGISNPHPALCTCASQNAVDCVRLHIKEEREALKVELGEAFYAWGFDEMGETVTDHWTWEEELTFQELVRKNPLSQNKNFWYHLFVAFPSRGVRELVSYYFNVFVLRRRAIQNRVNPLNIDSDDDEMVLDSEDDSVSLFESDDEIDESQVDAAASDDAEVDGSSSHAAEDSVDEDNPDSSDFGESSHEVESTFVKENIQIHTKGSSGAFCTQHSNTEEEDYLSNQISECSHDGGNQRERSQALRNWEIIPWSQQNQCHSYRDEGKSELPYVTYPISDREALYDCSACKESFLVNSHGCVIDQCETKDWEAPSLLSSQKDVDKLISTKGMMEEFFGVESQEGRK